MAPGLRIFSDAPISTSAFDVLGRKAVAARLIEVVMLEAQLPIVIGLVGPAGSGKTSVLQMAGELCAARGDLRAFALDAWVAGDAAKVNDAFLREVSQIFLEEKVTTGTEKVRDRLFAVGDVVSAVARFAGVKVDVKGALERSPDQLREEVVTLTEAIGKRIVVFIDHLDRLPSSETVAVLRLIQRWGRFPYFAFVVGMDRAQVVDNLRRVEGDAEAIERICALEVALPATDRAELAGWMRRGLVDLAAAFGIPPEPALALFAVDGGPGLGVVTTLRHAKRLLNTLAAVAPLDGTPIDLRATCLRELVRQFVPEAYPLVVERLPLAVDEEGWARLGAELARLAARQVRPDVCGPLLAALTSG